MNQPLSPFEEERDGERGNRPRQPPSAAALERGRLVRVFPGLL